MNNLLQEDDDGRFQDKNQSESNSPIFGGCWMMRVKTDHNESVCSEACQYEVGVYKEEEEIKEEEEEKNESNKASCIIPKKNKTGLVRHKRFRTEEDRHFKNLQVMKQMKR
jgi:hypothetical protein